MIGSTTSSIDFQDVNMTDSQVNTGGVLGRVIDFEYIYIYYNRYIGCSQTSGDGLLIDSWAHHVYIKQCDFISCDSGTGNFISIICTPYGRSSVPKELTDILFVYCSWEGGLIISGSTYRITMSNVEIYSCSSNFLEGTSTGQNI
jgi:hypothetical protein